MWIAHGRTRKYPAYNQKRRVSGVHEDGDSKAVASDAMLMISAGILRNGGETSDFGATSREIVRR